MASLVEAVALRRKSVSLAESLSVRFASVLPVTSFEMTLRLIFRNYPSKRPKGV